MGKRKQELDIREGGMEGYIQFFSSLQIPRRFTPYMQNNDIHPSISISVSSHPHLPSKTSYNPFDLPHNEPLSTIDIQKTNRLSAAPKDYKEHQQIRNMSRNNEKCQS
jgi:hypothetical protein